MLTIGNRIKHAIDQADLNQTQIATFCGVTPQAVSGWIKTSKIECENLARVSKLTKTRMYWLQTGDGPKEDRAAIDEFRALRHGEIDKPALRITRPAEIIIGKMIEYLETDQLATEDLQTIWALVERMKIPYPPQTPEDKARHRELSEQVHDVTPTEKDLGE